MNETKHSASTVLLSGDSAGGNLALAVLSHLSHPHKDIPALDLNEPLMGMLLISPWTSASLSYPSVTANKYKDMIPEEASAYWMNAFKGGADVPSDAYIEAATAPATWWEDAKAQDTIVLAGQEEILLGAITEFVKKYKVWRDHAERSFGPLLIASWQVNKKNTSFVVGKSEPNDGAIFGGTKTDTGTAIDAWLKTVL